MVSSAVTPDDVVMELGTGLGLIATFCAKRIGPDRVFTYEANPQMEPLIRETFALNGVAPSLSMCLLGASAGEQPFFLHRDFWASSKIQSEGNTVQVSVPVRPLNEELARINPTFLVIDIEGGELELLDGIAFRNVRKVCMEVHEFAIGAEGVRRVREILNQAGFAPDPSMSTERVWLLQRPAPLATLPPLAAGPEKR